MIKKKEIKKILPKREKDSSKGTFGKVLNIAGSKHYSGAAYLSSIAALRVGAGYVTLASSEQICQTIAAMTPDITFLQLKNLDELAINFMRKLALDEIAEANSGHPGIALGIAPILYAVYKNAKITY